jgi:uncharacterized protein DUF6510
MTDLYPGYPSFPDHLDYLDGNALAGPLLEIFATDVTIAICTCASCGRIGPFAEARVYTRAPGVVARCPGCDGVLLRFVRTPARAVVDVRGMASLQLAVPDED